MGDENPIHTLGDYSKPSHEGYSNTIELLAGNNVVQIFNDHIDCITQEGIDYAAGLNDTFTSDEVNFSYKNPNVKQLLRIIERKVDTLMKDGISLMGSSEGIFRITTNKMCQPPTEPSRQEEFEHIVMNFIYDQEERIKQLENYMQDITDELMELSLEVTLRLKERIKENKSTPRKIEKITKYPDTKVLENSARHNFLENLEKKMFCTPTNHLCIRYVQLIPSNLSQPRKDVLEFKPGKGLISPITTQAIH
ncbi:hypothetical protein Tco_1107801 [Tanacetum coccineum]